METCKVEFIHQSGQKIIIDFSVMDNGDLDYKPFFEPPLVDPKTNLGLSGQLCEMFITSLLKTNKMEDDGSRRENKD